LALVEVIFENSLQKKKNQAFIVAFWHPGVEV